MPIKWTSLDEMDKLLERYNLPRPKQEETDYMNRPITSTEVEVGEKTVTAMYTSKDNLTPLAVQWEKNQNKTKTKKKQVLKLKL